MILFEMLAGRSPFQSTTPLSFAFKHLTDPIPSIRLFRPNLPADAENILNKAMAKDREMRYATALKTATEIKIQSDLNGMIQKAFMGIEPSGDSSVPESSAILPRTEIHPVR